MAGYNNWVIRALAARLRQPGMRPQRRFMMVVVCLTAILFAGALVYLFRQPTEEAMETAAIKVFALAGVFIAVVIGAAIIVRKRTGARWSHEEALKMAGESPEVREPKGRP